MINLTSTDYLTVNTDAAGAISVHVSWVDQNGTTFTPGNTNTTITTATTTTILASPAASTLRNAKFISVKNTSASVANGVIISVEDGAGSWPLYFAPVLAAGESITFFDGRGWERYNSNGIPVVIGNTGPVDVQVFTTTTSNWIKPTAFVPTQVLVKLWGAGGGGGGGGSAAFATACKGGAGGGGGACAVRYFLASDLSSTVVVGLGAGGSSGNGNLSAAGSAGGNGAISTFGGYLSAYGGGGGGGPQAISAILAGAGGGTGGAANLAAIGLPSGGFDGGGGNIVSSVPLVTEFGGIHGATTNATPAFPASTTGIASIFGGSGGAAAGWRTASGQAVGPNITQQACGRFPGGSGVTSTTPTAGAAGAAGNSIYGGSGGGAGGNSNNAAVNGGAGGAGGQGGGGGGGGGLTIAGNTGGAGGIGGKGYCVVISW